MIPVLNINALGRPVSRLVMGTSFMRVVGQHDVDGLFDAYVECGGNCFDTSLVYYNVEDCLGDWMSRRNNRTEMVIQAKCAHHDTFRKRVTPADIRDDLNETLRRLQTTYVDLFVLHRDDPDQAVGPILECLAELQSTGRIRAFGASNWSVPRLIEANEYVHSHGLTGFAISSPNLALAFPNEPSWPNCITACDKFSRNWYQKTKMPLFAWSSLALGFFSGQYKARATLCEIEYEKLLADSWARDVVRVYYSERNFERLARAQELARSKGATSIQIALAWVLCQPMNVFAVIGPRSVAELTELWAAASIHLSTAELAWLNLETN